MSGPDYKNTVRIIASLTAICLLLAGSLVFDETWGQWATNRPYWTNVFASNVHSNPFLILFVFFPIVLVNFLMLPIVGIWWIKCAKKNAFPHAIVAALFILLLASAASYFPSDDQYLKMARYILGPSPMRKY